jgi:flagellar biosynthetic protein FliR
MLQDFLTTGVFAFILTFVRIGTAVMIMPGVGDTFTPANIRLHIALGLSLVLAPFIAPSLPHPVPATGQLIALAGMEFVVGVFFGSIARIFMAALDTAGMVMSVQSGLGSAQLFNPAFATQGSLIGSFITIAGILILFCSNAYQMLFYGLVGSYQLFPVGSVPDAGSMLEIVSRAISGSFLVSLEIAAPFIIVTTLVYIGMGVLNRLMPQIQVFMLAMPLQILLSLLTLALCISACMLFWLTKFQDAMTLFFSGG